MGGANLDGWVMPGPDPDIPINAGEGSGMDCRSGRAMAEGNRPQITLGWSGATAPSARRKQPLH